MIEKFREWQKQNPEWQLICDMPSNEVDALYEQFEELPKAERMHWVGTYREDSKAAFEEFEIKRCKVERKFLNEALEFCDKWPVGHAMTVYKIKSNASHEARSKTGDD
jgi:hypothetical protein